MTLSSSFRGTGIAAVAVVAAATALSLFPRAVPLVSLEQNLTRDAALVRADSFFRAHSLAPASARRAVHFEGNDSLRTFVELAAGGADSFNALVRGRDIAPFTWTVRAFTPRDPREARVEFAPDGRVIGFSQTLAEGDRRPTVAPDSGQRLAEQALGAWINDRAERWKLVSSSYETRKTSGRVDRTYTYERTDRRVGSAPVRAEVVVAGNAAAKVRQYVDVPESFRRRYGEMRSANDLLALIAGLGALAIAIAGIVFVNRASRTASVRWRPAMFVGGVIGVLTVGAGLNEMSAGWYSYDSALSPTAFQARIAFLALLAGGLTGLLTALTLAAAELATRLAFPWQLDWWKLWRYRGTRDVASRVASGYAVATIGFAYVALFYLVTRSVLGWWVPSEMLDNPNLIATPMPWLSGIAISLNAGVWEETLFRALPLSLLSMWVGQRPGRRWWMAAGVIATALTFGFAHSNYPSWPAYSRGVEIFVDACFWAVLVINFGVLVTVVAHFVYDLVLFGLFATSGNGAEYRVSAAIILVALLAPALAVAWRWARQRGFTTAPDDARFAAWTVAAPVEEAVVAPVAHPAGPLTVRARRIAIAAALVAAAAALIRPTVPTLGPQFTADRAHVLSTADSVVRARGADPAGWRRLTSTGVDTLAQWPRFLRAHALIPRAQRFASSYVPPTWWVVRYVHTAGSAADRAEEWRVRLWPDGRPLDSRHIIADATAWGTTPPDSVRRVALAALTRAGIPVQTLREVEFKETARPARRDVTVTYTDTAVVLPDGAVARAWVTVAGDEPLVVRRGVELPEAFLRADRERRSTEALIAALCGLVLFGGIITGVLMVTRRLPVVLHDGVLDRRATMMFLAGLVILAVLGSLNAMPTAFFSYDTTEPWSRFVGTRWLALVTAIPLSLFVLGIWLALGALRRRIGIPMLDGEPSPSASNDMLLAGVGLGGLFFALSRLGELVPGNGMPRVPSTLLTESAPVLGGLTAVPSATLMLVSGLGIPILMVIGLAKSWWARALMAATMGALLLAMVTTTAPAADVNVAHIAMLAGTVVLMAIAMRAWASSAALSWIVAALAFQGLGGLRRAVYSPTWQEHAAGLLVLVFAGLLIAVVARWTRDSRCVGSGYLRATGPAASVQ